ncbi:Flp pilus assembly protein CpaB [Catenuloplanes indicus]|uniref:Pilus assembly protein CpaB n=1 Tax=Catenuloplanes indicus TaxID=137267 RepID=A0AAE4B292_9ACTN|nr:Flp pilus assembly protein CpaB [Catenuloplanes indicus]MDQ0368763.1 pilus assembly protein CpaB [Catenuloplanes indicus]
MKRRMLAVMAALVLAAFGGFAVIAYVRGAEERAVAQTDPVWVLVSTGTIPAGTTGAQIRERGLTQRVAMPAETVPQGALGELAADLDGLALTGEVGASQLLLAGMFGTPTALTGGLPVPAGKLAVSVQVGAAAQVAGYVRPGATVTIFNTYESGDGRVTRVLLPEVDVIGVGERGSAGAAVTAVQQNGAETAPATTMLTVAVDQDQAERLVHASQTGSLYLALRDETARVSVGDGVTDRDLFN